MGFNSVPADLLAPASTGSLIENATAHTTRTLTGAAATALTDRRFREDLIDAAILEQRRKEPARPLREYLATRPRRARG